MESPIVLHFERDAHISFTLIGQQREIASFLGYDTRDGDSSPLIFATPDGDLPPAFDQFRADLSASRAYFADPAMNQPPGNLNLGNRPVPDKLKPILPLLPEELRGGLYYIKPDEETPSILTLVSMQDLEHWLTTQRARKYRSASHAVRDMFLQRPDLLLNLRTNAPSASPYPRVRAYPKPRMSSRSLLFPDAGATDATLAICIQASQLGGRLCVRMPDQCSVDGRHTWIISGGGDINLTVTIKTGIADLACGETEPQTVSAPRSQSFEVPPAETRLDITAVGAGICKYRLTNACFSGTVGVHHEA